MDRRANRIKLEDCQHRKLYRLLARNISIGVFDKTTEEFIGIRTKFARRFLDGESHWDAPQYATCAPMEVIGELPPEISIEQSRATVCLECKQAVHWELDEIQEEKVLESGHPWKSARGTWYHSDASSTCKVKEIRPVSLPNNELFNWLDEQLKITGWNDQAMYTAIYADRAAEREGK